MKKRLNSFCNKCQEKGISNRRLQDALEYICHLDQEISNIGDTIDTPSGFEAIDEGNGIAWRLIGQAPSFRLPAGNSSVDGSIYSSVADGAPDSPSSPIGAGSVGAVNFGVNNKDTGSFYNSLIGAFNETSDFAGTSHIGLYNFSSGGYGNFLAGSYNTIMTSNFNSFAFAIGHNNLIDAGINPGGALGTALTVRSRNHVAVGVSNVPWLGGDTADRPIFTVGIGTTTTPAGRWAPLVPKDGLNVLLDGTVRADSLTTTLIDSEPTGRVLVTKEWAQPKKIYNTFNLLLDQVLVDQTSGTLDIGKTYIVDGQEVGDDFSNVGYVADGVPFVATGTTPNVWTNGSYVANITDSQPTVNVLENDFTGVNFTYTYDYNTNDITIEADSPIFLIDKTGALSGNIGSSNTVPLGVWRIDDDTMGVNLPNSIDRMYIEIKVYN